MARRICFSPEAIHRLQKAVRTGSFATYKSYAQLIDDQSTNLCTLRGLLEFRAGDSIAIEEVESVESIVRRFKTGGHVLWLHQPGSARDPGHCHEPHRRQEQHREGGEDPERYQPLPNGDSRNFRHQAVASGRFGVTSEYLVNARELQIKMAQGAKPARRSAARIEGLPWVAKTRHTTAGVGLISPPPAPRHLLDRGFGRADHDLRTATAMRAISVKLVAEVGVGTIAAGVAKAHAKVVLISGYDGGTGASPQTSITTRAALGTGSGRDASDAGAEQLRSRITVETDGQLKTGRDVAIAALLGARNSASQPRRWFPWAAS